MNKVEPSLLPSAPSSHVLPPQQGQAAVAAPSAALPGPLPADASPWASDSRASGGSKRRCVSGQEAKPRVPYGPRRRTYQRGGPLPVLPSSPRAEPDHLPQRSTVEIAIRQLIHLGYTTEEILGECTAATPSQVAAIRSDLGKREPASLADSIQGMFLQMRGKHKANHNG